MQASQYRRASLVSIYSTSQVLLRMGRFGVELLLVAFAVITVLGFIVTYVRVCSRVFVMT